MGFRKAGRGVHGPHGVLKVNGQGLGGRPEKIAHHCPEHCIVKVGVPNERQDTP